MEQGEASPDANTPRRRYEALAAVVDGGVFELDADRRVARVGEEFVEQTGYASDDAGGEPLAALFGDDAGRIERALDGLGAADATLTVTVESATGESTPFELRLRGVGADDESGVVGVLSPAANGTDERVHEPQERQRVLREVYDVATDPAQSFEQRVDALLALVRETIGTEYAALSRVDGDDYVFRAIDTRSAVDIESGDVVPLDATNCERVVDSEQTVVFRNLAEDAPELVDRAGNVDWGVSCYLGAPVAVDGDVRGTFCFYGTEPRTDGFSEWEVTLVDLVAEWVSYERTQQRTRKRLERRNDAVEASRRRYETLVANVPNGAVALVDDDLRYVTVGGSPVDADGRTAEDLEGLRVEDALSGELADVLAPRYRAALDGESSAFEHEIGDRVNQFHVFPVYDDGEVTAAMGMSQDVTERAEREQQLARYETIFETLNDGIYVTDEDGYYEAVNDRFADITGYSRAELRGEHASQFVDESTLERAAEIRAAAGDDETPTLGTTVETKGGDEVPVEVTFSSLETRDGERQLVGAARDITERREQRRRIEESERRYRTLVENFPNGAVGLFDEDLRYTAVGGELVDEGDISPADRVGRRVHDIYPDHLVEEIEPYLEAALAGEAQHFETSFRGNHLSARVLPIRGPSGDVDGGMLVVQDVTEQKERERALADAKAQMEAAAQAGAVGTWEWHIPEDRFVAGTSLARLFGIDPERAREGVPLDEFVGSIHEDDRERVAAAIDEAVETCGDYEEEYRVYDADGDVRWIVARGHVECEDGEPVTFPGAITDITEQKRAEREIEQHREQLETLFEVLPVGVVVANDDGELVEANGIAKRIWGGADFDAESVEEYDQYTAWWADSGERVESDEYALARVLDGEPVVEPDVYDIEGADGSERVIEVRGMPVFDDGEVARGVITMTDVTERAERDRTLERRARQQRVVADLGQRALDTDDLDELMAQVAEQVADALENDYCKVLDLDDDARELLLRQGVGWDDGVIGNATVDADDDSQAGYTLLSEEAVVVDDLAVEDRFSGPELLTSHDVESGVSTIIGSPAEPWGILGTHDTSHKQFSEEDVNFVQSVANILADAIERERYDAEREQLVADLAESNERLEQFAYAASHDLQEPLRMVSSYLSLIEDRYGDALDEDGREFLDYAVDGADRMQEMIDALLEYSRVERGAAFESVDLDAVFADVCRDFEVKIDDNDATVVAESLPTVSGDEDQLRQVFGNLLSNAIEYSEGPPTVRVAVERDGNEWVFAVSDDGIGIDPDHADRIFEVFQRLHTHDEHPGTGVGLALIQRIVERHGGDVWVESTPGEGSTFYFSIPDRGQRDD
ncbi:PAS domain S-box protein [Halobacterium noricense]|uniref:PAS domain S-box protein n=1 Tax=Halobacterium noricense TaxID=223182 RepID=UPI001E45848B|nr:PAS domain S-box protein [Halobacterium noricense]UHH24213.1 PAS domain S-box protein [Halobacterium noricense]